MTDGTRTLEVLRRCTRYGTANRFGAPPDEIRSVCSSYRHGLEPDPCVEGVEGHTVSVAFAADGALTAASSSPWGEPRGEPCGSTRTVRAAFVPLEDVMDVWEAA